MADFGGLSLGRAGRRPGTSGADTTKPGCTSVRTNHWSRGPGEPMVLLDIGPSHPGKRPTPRTMIVDLCMTRRVETVTPETPLGEAVQRMLDRNIRRLVVVRGRAIVGMICRQDITRAFPPGLNPFSVAGIGDLPSAGLVADFMHSPVVTIEADQPVEAAARRMTEHHIGGLPVVQGDKLVGIVTESDIFRVFAKLLSGQPGSSRITFDITQKPDALVGFVRLCGDLHLEVTSIITFNDDVRRLAVARIQGTNTDRLIDRLWDTGQSVLSVVG